MVVERTALVGNWDLALAVVAALVGSWDLALAVVECGVVLALVESEPFAALDRFHCTDKVGMGLRMGLDMPGMQGRWYSAASLCYLAG